MIIIHIPIGNDFSIALWDDVINALVDRYSNNIKGLFSAHTHNDHLIFHRSRDNREKIIKTQFVGPSLTTFSYLNPSFRVIEVDADTNEVVDYTQYRLNITKWNDIGPTAQPRWEPIYKFRQEFGVQDATVTSMQMIYDKFRHDYHSMSRYVWNYYTGNRPLEQQVSATEAVRTLCEMYSNSRDQFRCLGLLAPKIASDKLPTLISSNLFANYISFKSKP